jgi:hypothetical protein
MMTSYWSSLISPAWSFLWQFAQRTTHLRISFLNLARLFDTIWLGFASFSVGSVWWRSKHAGSLSKQILQPQNFLYLWSKVRLSFRTRLVLPRVLCVLPKALYFSFQQALQILCNPLFALESLLNSSSFLSVLQVLQNFIRLSVNVAIERSLTYLFDLSTTILIYFKSFQYS